MTLLFWAAWVTLALTLGLLIYIAVARELPVPGFVQEQVDAQLAGAHLEARYDRARFDPTGRILLENVRLRARQFDEPLLTARFLYLRYSFWSLLSGHTVPDETRFEGVMLQLPAILSPSGTAEPLVRELAGTLRQHDGVWQIDQLAGRINNLALTAHGTYTQRRTADGAPAFTEIVGRFLQTGRKLVLAAGQLQAFEQPALDLTLESVSGVGNTADLFFTVQSVRQPAGFPLLLDRLAATATVRLDGAGSRPLRLHVAVARAEYGGQYSAGTVRAVVSAQWLPAGFTLVPGEALVACGEFQAFDESALAPVLRAQLAHWPDIRIEAALQLRGELLAAEVEARLREQSARLHASGRVAAALVSAVLSRWAPKAAPYFQFGDPVGFNLEAGFASGWHFSGLSGRVHSGRLDSRGVLITSARGRVALDPQGGFLADDALVVAGDGIARGSYWMNFFTHDYRMLLEGRLHPLAISGWFRSDWWSLFWHDFDFAGGPPQAEVEVSGRWSEPARTVYFGRAQAAGATVLGADFATVQTRLFVRPQFQHALDFTATRGGGTQRATGTFKRFGNVRTRETHAIEFDLTSNLDAALYGRMAPHAAPALLAAWNFSAPPRVHAAGRIDGAGEQAAPNLSFTGRVAGPLRYNGLPIDALNVSGGVTGRDLRLDMIEFGFAGGKGTGKASLGGPAEARLLGFDVYLKEADLARTIRAMEAYEAARTGGAENLPAESKFIKRASGGRLDLSLSAQGQPRDIASFHGGGNAALTGAELGEIHLFGLLSQVLSAVSLNFSSLKLDTARTSFQLEGGHIRFPDLKISGPSAVIDARGDYLIASKSLDFTARLKPYEETHNPLTAALGIVLNPLARIFELKLNGPLAKPSWSLAFGSGGSGNPAATPPAVPPDQTPPPPAGEKK